VYSTILIPEKEEVETGVQGDQISKHWKSKCWEGRAAKRVLQRCADPRGSLRTCELMLLVAGDEHLNRGSLFPPARAERPQNAQRIHRIFRRSLSEYWWQISFSPRLFRVRPNNI
jgi:hypothetical protein